ncbi:glycosyltransferase [Hymenobacter taeanensis]|uniref:Glycosyltransferase n=1 Tax=Hymenobacter taeanensis TaxID=2735321 RepID=A0A6M6BIE1_9BACT|nr:MULTISPECIES: glycosyltransferase [Hymenobacter]QJX47564.1 glycosyltransferase [Hymenobacter taeanensis]UOQ82953.1 glycosyltransferase [Hymenobacter sp. 5414T-23]
MSSSAPHVLFISYDGMTDPLGQSQVLPYLVGLSQAGYSITLLSTEKKERFAQHERIIREITDQAGIRWEYIFFTRKPPVLAKMYDRYQLQQKAMSLHKDLQFDMTHCRSYVSAEVGLLMKRRFGVKFLFDMRGFWVDERVEGGMWNLQSPIYRRAYKTYKRKEAEFIAAADGIISLTENGKGEMQTWPAYPGTPITVIPCSADFSVFPLLTAHDRQVARQKLGYGNEDLVISYLGSIGAWYLLDEMLAQFAVIKQHYSGAKMLFITQEPKEMVLAAARQVSGLAETDFIVRPATRKEVPELVAASNLNLFFIKQSYSKKASSPTKLGEILAMGLPVICNDGVGDVADIVRQTDGGTVVSNLDMAGYEAAARSIPELLQKDGAELRHKAQEYYDLETAIGRYRGEYRRLLGQ